MSHLRPIDLSYINASWLPVSHIPINYARLEAARANYPNNEFIAAFYGDGQIAHFTYYIDGNWKECIHLDLTHRRKTGRIGRIDSSSSKYGWMGVGYSHKGEVEDENPWSDGIPGDPKDFHQWVEESIVDIVWFGIDHQVVGLGKAAQEVVTRDIWNFLHTHISRINRLVYPSSASIEIMAVMARANLDEELRANFEKFGKLEVNISPKRAELLEFITFGFGE
ncbi:hypothetical protein JOY44_30200 (plasmid) [Phormidium sp. CLA17]|uniref:hypothetical protein n=1 Tax=Leptolyngbya sp. Cla-17 TaxID=2803751 RepID=UPI001492FC04|nr:hypothetical protein [Leptolyngbya sp. Cla-17]MBM0745690.1 hypothetical protein [Leptolyngbya sp. Cla-17]